LATERKHLFLHAYTRTVALEQFCLLHRSSRRDKPDWIKWKHPCAIMAFKLKLNYHNVSLRSFLRSYWLFRHHSPFHIFSWIWSFHIFTFSWLFCAG